MAMSTMRLNLSLVSKPQITATKLFTKIHLAKPITVNMSTAKLGALLLQTTCVARSVVTKAKEQHASAAESSLPVIVIIAGASGSIAKAIALEFLRRGCMMLMSCDELSTEEVTKMRNWAEACEGEFRSFLGNIRRTDVAEELIMTAIRQWGKIDVLVNCCGCCMEPWVAEENWRIMPIFEMTVECSEALIKLLPKGQDAPIVNIGHFYGLDGAADSKGFAQNSLVTNNLIKKYTMRSAVEHKGRIAFNRIIPSEKDADGYSIVGPLAYEMGLGDAKLNGHIVSLGLDTS